MLRKVSFVTGKLASFFNSNYIVDVVDAECMRCKNVVLSKFPSFSLNGGTGGIGVNQVKIIFNNVSLITFLNDIPEVNPSSATIKLHDVSTVFIV